MHLHINHCFCLDSNWGGTYDSSYMVCIDSLKKLHQEDYKNISKKFKMVDEFDYKYFMKDAKSKQEKAIAKKIATKTCYTFSDDVIDYLNEKVEEVNGEKGWAVGSKKYQARNETELIIWFKRKKDAMNFIKKFSIYKNPTTIFDYFDEKRFELDLKTLKIKKVMEFSEEIEAWVD